MARFTFTATLYKLDPTYFQLDGWVCLDIPEKISRNLGPGRVPVCGTINGISFRTSLFTRKSGPPFMIATKKARTEADVEIGEKVKVEIERDLTPRTIVVPPDLAKALSYFPEAKKFFEASPFSMRKWFVQQIMDAKSAATRERRIEKTVVKMIEFAERKAKK